MGYTRSLFPVPVSFVAARHADLVLLRGSGGFADCRDTVSHALVSIAVNMGKGIACPPGERIRGALLGAVVPGYEA
jgi:hypothetical protein